MSNENMKNSKIRVLIVDDLTILRNSLKYLVEKSGKLCVVGTASNGHEALDLCIKEEPDIVLMDLKMPVCVGVEATSLIKNRFPKMKIIILTTFNDAVNIREALRNGASGYVLKDIDEQELISAIKNTHKGFAIIHQEVLDTLTNQIRNESKKVFTSKEATNPDGKTLLNDREIEIVSLMAHGKPYKEIAKVLYISEGTLRNYISEILRKLKLKDKTQLIVYAIRNKLI